MSYLGGGHSESAEIAQRFCFGDVFAKTKASNSFWRDASDEANNRLGTFFAFEFVLDIQMHMRGKRQVDPILS